MAKIEICFTLSFTKFYEDQILLSLYVLIGLRLSNILPSNNMYLEQEYICIQMAFVSIDCI